jgi:septation ring formation regulator EzrA
MQKNLQDEIAKVTKTYGASATNAFPAFNFSEPTLESVEQDMLEVKH